MESLMVKCPDSGCWKFFPVRCDQTAQTFYCQLCKNVFTFVNLGLLVCTDCNLEKRVPLNTLLYNIHCDKCSRDIGDSSNKSAVITAYRFEEHFNVQHMIQYCGLSSFSNSEQEVNYARATLAKVGALHATSGLFSSPKKAMFIRKLEPTKINFEDVPVQYVQQLHAYCNFKMHNGHENAKFMGLLAGFADGFILRDLIKNYGLVDIWLSSEELRRELLSFPNIEPYASRLKVI